MSGTGLRPLRFELVSFDLDGTLVDTASEICEAANLALEAHGIARRPEAEITHLIGAGTRELMRRLIALCVADQSAAPENIDPEALFESFDQHYARTTGTRARAYSGAHAALRRLRDAGLRLACVTNKEYHHAARVLAATGLQDCFDLVIGGDSLPEKKPHPTVLQHVAAALGTTPGRTAHVGDSSTDVQAARNAGTAAWAVPYGYNSGRPIAESSPDELFANLQQVADHVLHHP